MLPEEEIPKPLSAGCWVFGFWVVLIRRKSIPWAFSGGGVNERCLYCRFSAWELLAGKREKVELGVAMFYPSGKVFLNELTVETVAAKQNARSSHNKSTRVRSPAHDIGVSGGGEVRWFSPSLLLSIALLQITKVRTGVYHSQPNIA